MIGKAKGKKIDGRTLRYVDQEVMRLFSNVLQMYGTAGTKIMLKAITEGKVKPKI